MDSIFLEAEEMSWRNISVWDLLKQYPPLQEKKGSGGKCFVYKLYFNVWAVNTDMFSIQVILQKRRRLTNYM